MLADPHRTLVERYLAAYNAFDVPGMLGLLDPGIEFRNLSGGEVTAQANGLHEFRALAEHAAGLFRSRRQAITHYTEHGNQAVVGIAYKGVLAADLSPHLRAGDTLELTGRSTFLFRDGRIARIVDES
ncbi:MAG TPA: nuclear transport factor 2 family protein [Gemmatimonadales bacterium]